MNKVEELRKIFMDLPQNNEERLLEQFMHHAKIVLGRARLYDDLVNRPVLGISIPYRHRIIRLNEMSTFYKKRDPNEKYEKTVRFSPDIKYPLSDLDKKLDKTGNDKPYLVLDKKEKGYVLSKKLISEGFKVFVVFSKERDGFWEISSIEVYI